MLAAQEFRTTLPALQTNFANASSSTSFSPSSSTSSASSSRMHVSPTYAPRASSPLSSPSLSVTSSACFPSPLVERTAAGSAAPQPQQASFASDKRRASSPAFPRSRPLRPIASALCMSSLSSAAQAHPGLQRRKSEEPRPINHMMKPNRGNGKVKMLVSNRKMNCFELNLSGRELARTE